MKKEHSITKNLIYLILLTLFMTMTFVACSGESSSDNPDSDAVHESSSQTNNSSSSGQNESTVISEGTVIEENISDLQVTANTFPALCVPTWITQIDGLYFIVDCYNNQVIYNDNLSDPLTSWKVMTSDIYRGHTIASNGKVYLIDDTENNRILVMKKGINSNGDTVFVRTQEFGEIGTRPHFIIYNSANETFYVWSSMTGEMYLFKYSDEKDSIYLSNIKSIPELNGYYVRSFSIIDNEIYLVSGDASVTILDIDTFEVKKKYPVPLELVGMVQITLIDDYYYITISTDGYGSQDAATIIRVKDLEDLAAGNYEDLYSNFIGGGTPYCISKIDNHYYLCEHRLPEHSIWRFDIEDNEIINCETIY